MEDIIGSIYPFQRPQHRDFTFYFEINLKLQKSRKNKSVPIHPASSNALTMPVDWVKHYYWAAHLTMKGPHPACTGSLVCWQDLQPA